MAKLKVLWITLAHEGEFLFNLNADSKNLLLPE